jgi:hypothetical protein
MACNVDIKKRQRTEGRRRLCVICGRIKTGNDSDNIYVIIQKVRFNRKKSWFFHCWKRTRDISLSLLNLFFFRFLKN